MEVGWELGTSRLEESGMMGGGGRIDWKWSEIKYMEGRGGEGRGRKERGREGWW